VDGQRYDDMPMTQTAFHHAEPVYEWLDGWSEDVSGCRSFEELPKAAQAYVQRIEELCGVRVSVIGVGPGRDENVTRHPLLG
jgi:adenylosuccinate synthase